MAGIDCNKIGTQTAAFYCALDQVDPDLDTPAAATLNDIAAAVKKFPGNSEEQGRLADALDAYTTDAKAKDDYSAPELGDDSSEAERLAAKIAGFVGYTAGGESKVTREEEKASKGVQGAIDAYVKATADARNGAAHSVLTGFANGQAATLGAGLKAPTATNRR